MDQNNSNYKTGIPGLDSLLNEKSIQTIELRSEEVQEIMNRIPPWILRRGITLLFVIVLLLLVGSWFFKYPDVIQAEITVTSQEPPASIIARSTGKIDEIYVGNDHEVLRGEPPFTGFILLFHLDNRRLENIKTSTLQHIPCAA